MKRNLFRKILLPFTAGLIMILAFLMLRSFIAEELLGSAPIPVAVIPFENRTGDTQYDNLKIIIQDLLITKLNDSKYIYVSTRERMRDVLKQMDLTEEAVDSDSWFNVCRLDGVEAVVIGSVNRAGDTFVTDVKVLDVKSKELIESASARGQGVASILDTQIDELGRRISRIVGLSERKAETIQQSIIELTTNSMEAYNYFIRGREDYDKFYFHDAGRFLKKAVELDPRFAVAYLYLSRTYLELGDDIAAYASLEKAMLFAQQATEAERLSIEADYVGIIERNLEKKYRILKKMAAKYPKDKRVFFNLGMIYHSSKALYSEAIETYAKALDLDPNFGAVLNDLAYTYADMGDYTKAIEYFEKYAFISPGDANPIDSMAEIYFRIGKLDEAVVKYKEALEIKPDFGAGFRIGYLYALMEDYEETFRWIDQFISTSPSPGLKAEGYLWKGFYSAWLGRTADAFSYFRKSETLADSSLKAMIDFTQGWILYHLGDFERSQDLFRQGYGYFTRLLPEMKWVAARNQYSAGRIDVAQDRIDLAQSRLDTIKSYLSGQSPANQEIVKSAHEMLKVEILLASAEYREALTILEHIAYDKIPPMQTTRIIPFNTLYEKDRLAWAYHQAGEIDKAIAEYERISRFNPDSKDRLLIHPKCHYRLARLYEEKGLKDKAIERYEKFLDIWKDADEELTEKQDAKVRLVRLKG